MHGETIKFEQIYINSGVRITVKHKLLIISL